MTLDFRMRQRAPFSNSNFRSLRAFVASHFYCALVTQRLTAFYFLVVELVDILKSRPKFRKSQLIANASKLKITIRKVKRSER